MIEVPLYRVMLLTFFCEALAFSSGLTSTAAGAGAASAMHVMSCSPSWRQPMGKWLVSSVNSHTDATWKRWHLWEIDLRFALDYSTPGRTRKSSPGVQWC